MLAGAVGRRAGDGGHVPKVNEVSAGLYKLALYGLDRCGRCTDQTGGGVLLLLLLMVIIFAYNRTHI